MKRVTRARQKTHLPRAATLPGPVVISTVFQDAFWNTDDVLLYTLRYLSLLDLIGFCQSNSRMRRMWKYLMRGRVTRYVCPFFAPSVGIDPAEYQIHKFFVVLRNTASWIVGSIALAALSVLSDPEIPSNLNIITSYLHRDDWEDFFQENGFTIRAAIMCRGAYATEGGRVTTFVHADRPHLIITVTTSTTEAITKLFLSAPNSNQQVAIGAHHGITTFPRWTSRQHAVQGYCPNMNNHPAQYAHADLATYRTTSPFDGVILHESSKTLPETCFEACPAVWRSTFGGRDIGHWAWGGLDGQDSHTDRNYHAMVRSRVNFRTGTTCENFMCAFMCGFIQRSA